MTSKPTTQTTQFSQKDLAKFRIHFDNLDVDGDGFITRKDLKVILRKKRAQEEANSNNTVNNINNNNNNINRGFPNNDSSLNSSRHSLKQWFSKAMASSSNYNLASISPETNGQQIEGKEQNESLLKIQGDMKKEQKESRLKKEHKEHKDEKEKEQRDELKMEEQHNNNNNNKEKEDEDEDGVPRIVIEGEIRIQIDDDIEQNQRAESKNESKNESEKKEQPQHHKERKERKGGKKGKRVEISDEDDRLIHQLFGELRVREVNFDKFLQLMTRVRNGDKTAWKVILDFTSPQERGILQSISGYALNFFGLNSNEESQMASSSFFARVDDPEGAPHMNNDKNNSDNANGDDKPSESATKKMIKQFSNLLGITDSSQGQTIKPSSSKLSVSGNKVVDSEASDKSEIQIKVDKQEEHKTSSDESIVFYDEDQPRTPKDKVLGISRSQSLLENFNSENDNHNNNKEIHAIEVEEIEGEVLEIDKNELKDLKSKGKKKSHHHHHHHHHHHPKSAENDDSIPSTSESPTPKRKTSRKASKASDHHDTRTSIDQEGQSSSGQEHSRTSQDHQDEDQEYHGARKRKNSQTSRHDSRDDIEMGNYVTSYIIQEEHTSAHSRDNSYGSDSTPRRSENSDYSFNQVTQTTLRDDYEDYYYSSDYEDDYSDSEQPRQEEQRRQDERRRRRQGETRGQQAPERDPVPQRAESSLYASTSITSSLNKVLQEPKVHKFLIRPKKTPFFMILVVLTQLVLLALCFVYQNGMESLSINPFAGPSNLVLIHLGAQFAYCMRAPTQSTFDRFNISSPDDLVACSSHQGSFGFSSGNSVNPNNTDPSIPTCKFSDVVQSTCGIALFGNINVPDQGWRVMTSIFLHVGVIHLVIILIFEFRVAFPMEREIGSIRMALIFLISGALGNAFALNMSPLGVTAGSSGAMMGIFALLFIDIFQNWPLLVSPRKNLTFLIIILIFVLGIGLFPFINNYSHFGGFVGGLLSGFIFVPSVNFGKRDRKRKLILLITSTIILLLLFFAAFYSFYALRFDGSTCEACSYVECVPHDSAWCVGAGYA